MITIFILSSGFLGSRIFINKSLMKYRQQRKNKLIRFIKGFEIRMNAKKEYLYY